MPATRRSSHTLASGRLTAGVRGGLRMRGAARAGRQNANPTSGRGSLGDQGWSSATTREPATDRQRRRDHRHRRGGARVVRAAAPDDARRPGKLRAGGRTEHGARPAHRRPRVPTAPRRLPDRRRDRLPDPSRRARSQRAGHPPVVGGTAATGYQTQGDNRDRPDFWRPTPSQIRGRMHVTLPHVGAAFAVARQPRVLATPSAQRLRSPCSAGRPAPPPPARRDEAVRARKARVIVLKPINETSVIPEPAPRRDAAVAPCARRR